MARSAKKTTGKDSTAYGASSKGNNQRIEFTFVNVAVNATDTSWLLANEQESGELITELLTSLSGGYKLSVSLDKQSGRFNATLACSDADDPNYGLILSFRGREAIDALYGLAYADLRKLEGQWRRESDEPSNRFG